jgi:hypothetical protein
VARELRLADLDQNIYEGSRRAYGSPRVAQELLAGGKKVSRQRVARIMKAASTRARKPRKFVATTDSRHKYPVAPNLPNVFQIQIAHVSVAEIDADRKLFYC